jgi:hypothetical protein
MERDLGVPVDLFSTFVNVCMVPALAIGGARLVWLFLSPVPHPVPELIERPRLLTLGRFAPLLLALGCAALVACVLIILWVKSGRPGWQNIFPLLVIYALALGGIGAILFGIAVQSILSDAYRGFGLEVETGNLQRNFDAALLAAFGVVMLAMAGWRWVPVFDPDIAERAAFDAQRLIVRAPLYLAILATLVRTYQVARDTAPDTGKAFNRVAVWGWIVLFYVASKTFDGVLPRDSAVDDFFARRGRDGDLMLQMVPIGYAHAEMLAPIGLALIMVLSLTSLIDMLARRGVSSPYVPKRAWPGVLFLCLALALTFIFARSGAPMGMAFKWSLEVALPVAIGMALVFAFPFLWRTGAAAWTRSRRIAARGVLMELLVMVPLIPLAIGLLYASSQLTRIGFASLLLGGAAAVALGWLRLPAAQKPADAVPAVFN